MRANRIDKIETYIQEQKKVSIDQLCEVFQISKATLRRDLDNLMPRGTIEKVYGGVVALPPKDSPMNGLISYSERNIKNAEAKDRIARLAAANVRDNDTIYLDTGTSTLRIIDYLGDVSNLTVITNSILIASKSLAYPNIKVIMLPGIINPHTASTVGTGCLEYLSRCHMQKAFMACTGINEAGASNASPEEYEVKKTALEQSRIHYLLVDNSKFDKSALMIYSALDNIHHIFTECPPPANYQKLFEQNGVEVDIAPQL